MFWEILEWFLWQMTQKEKNNLEVFLPIHPNILIGLSENLPKNAIIDDNFVANFNRIAKEDSYKNVYSASEITLNTLK